MFFDYYYMRWCIFTANKMHMLSPYCWTRLSVHIYWFPSDSTLDISIIIFITNIPDSLLRYLFHCLSVCLDISIIIIEDIKTVYTNTHKYSCNHEKKLKEIFYYKMHFKLRAAMIWSDIKSVVLWNGKCYREVFLLVNIFTDLNVQLPIEWTW
jgi:hypothetical protein